MNALILMCASNTEKEIDPTDSTPSSKTFSELAASLFRKLVGLNWTFFATLRALTLSPITAFENYVRGNRSGLMGPLGFLATTVGAKLLLSEFFTTFGPTPSSQSTPDSTPSAFVEFQEAVNLANQVFGFSLVRSAFIVLVVVVTAAVLIRVLDEKLPDRKTALGLSSYLYAQVTIVTIGVQLVSTGLGLLYLQFSLPTTPIMLVVIGLGIVTPAAYIWVALYGSVGANWWHATRGFFGVLWAWLLAGLTVGGVQLIVTSATAYWTADTLEFFGVVYLILGFLFLIPPLAQLWYGLTSQPT